jgi:hypothetical protein
VFDPQAAGTAALGAVMQALGEQGFAIEHIAICYDGREVDSPDGVTFGSHVWPGEGEHHRCHACNLATAIQAFLPVPSDGSAALLLHFPTDASVWIETVREVEREGGDDDATG